MDLSTFGAILSYAVELETKAAEFYGGNAQGKLEEVFTDLAGGSDKRVRRLELIRQEGISEMILEPITGFNSGDHSLDKVSEAGEPLKQAFMIETVMGEFYSEGSKKIPIREVVRVFQRMAEDNNKRKVQLEKLLE